MTVNVYPSTMPGEPIERHHISGMSLYDWLAENAPGCLEGKGEARPISASINGHVIPPREWPDVMLNHGVDVDIRVQPQGVETALIAAVVAGAVAAAAAFLLKPSIPSVNSSESAKGSRLLEVSGTGNQPKLGDVIPDQAGRCKKFPDLLTAPVRRFVDNKTQALYLFFSLGVGEYERDDNDLAIGETPVNTLDAVSYQFFEPGDDVSGHEAAQNWYNAPEVGATSGGSGIHLMSTRDIEQQWDASLSLSGTRISGANQPQGWVEGLILRLGFNQPVTVTREDPLDENSDNIYEANIRWLVPSNGLELLVATDPSTGFQRRIAERDPVAGTFKLQFYDGSTWVNTTSVAPGSYQWRFSRWQDAYESYRITAVNDGSFDLVLQLNGSDVAGWSGFPSGTSNILIDVDLSFAEGIWSNAFLACPRSEKTSRIEWDVFAPQGLGFITDNGDVEERGRWIELEYREAGSDGAWALVGKNIKGRTRDQLGWTFSHDLPSPMTPEVRLRRVEAEENDVKALDKLEWYGLRSQLPQNNNYPGVSTLAMVITGSQMIAAQTENQVNLIDTRKLPVWDGSEWTAPQATRDIAPYARYIAHSKGYTDDDIDMSELLRLDAIWKSRGDTFDFIFNSSTTMKDALNTVLRAGMAELTIDHGRLRPVREELRTVPEHMYTLQNMPGELRRKFTGPRPEDPDGIDVEYTDEENWTTEVVECRLPGDAGIRPKKVRLDGVVNRDKAYQIGMRERSRLAYQRWEYEWSTECDGLNSKYKSFCALADDVPGYGRSAILLAVEVDGANTHLQSSEPFDWEDGESYVIAWRRPDGTLAGPYPSQRGDSDDHVITQLGGDPEPVIYNNMEPPHLLWGTTERWSYRAIIEDVEPQGFESVTLRALNYDARVYAYDDAVAPIT